MVRQERRLIEARGLLRVCSGASCPAAIRADCVEWLDQLGRSLPTVVVTARAKGVDLANVRVFIDGKLITERLSGATLEVDPGQHQFRFEAPPWPTVERNVLVSEGVKDRSIDVVFAPPDEVPTSLRPRRRLWHHGPHSACRPPITSPAAWRVAGSRDGRLSRSLRDRREAGAGAGLRPRLFGLRQPTRCGPGCWSPTSRLASLSSPWSSAFIFTLTGRGTF